MAAMFYHPKSGKSAPAQGRPSAGWIVAEELVDVRNGHTMWISREPSVNSGQGVAMALSLVRDDAGHEGDPSFMTLDAYARLPAQQRAALRQESVGVPPSASERRVAELEAEVAALRAAQPQSKRSA